MIYERLKLGLDIEKLKIQLETEIEKFPPIMQTRNFGGWSVLSSNGDISDGWQMGHKCFKETKDGTISDIEGLKKLQIMEEDAYSRPTEICRGYLADVLTELKKSGLEIFRARISLLKSGGETSIHRDGLDEFYHVRLHIPIKTNTDCFFATEEGRAHFPADGSGYLVKVNRMHAAMNYGKTDRYHLMMGIRDFKGVTEFHRAPGPEAFPKHTGA